MTENENVIDITRPPGTSVDLVCPTCGKTLNAPRNWRLIIDKEYISCVPCGAVMTERPV